MAEVATVVGIVGFGAQCAKGILELTKLIQSIRDAPDDLLTLLNDIKLLQIILHDLELQHNSFAGFSPPSPIWGTARQSCETAANQLEAVTSETLEKIRKGRLRGSVRATLRRDNVEKSLDRLKQLKLDLLLAGQIFGAARAQNLEHLIQQASFHGILPDRPALPSRRVRYITDVSNSGGGSDSVHSDTDILVSSCTDDIALFPAIDCTSVRTRTPKKRRKEFSVGSLWIGKIVKLRLEAAYSSFGLHVTYHDVVSWDAPVFMAARRGKLAEVRYLLDSRQASIHAIDVFGQSVLDVGYLMPLRILLMFTACLQCNVGLNAINWLRTRSAVNGILQNNKVSCCRWSTLH